MSKITIPVLQNRWKLERNKLKYYGLRNYPHTFDRVITLRKSSVEFIKRLDGLTALDKLRNGKNITPDIKKLIAEKIIVDKSGLRSIPNALSEAQYCKKCVGNDFFIPGLEFDKTGTCAICQAHEKAIHGLPSIIPTVDKNTILNIAKNNQQSRFDVAILYSGGKDSSFLLYYLAKVLKVRVLACVIRFPFNIPAANANIETAKKRLTNVEFIERTLLMEDLEALNKSCLKAAGNICFCSSLFPILYYPTLVMEKVPIVMDAVEAVQYRGFILNNVTSPMACKLANSKFVNTFINILKLLTFQLPYKVGTLPNVMFLEDIVFGKSFLFKSFQRKEDYLVTQADILRDTVPHLLDPVRTLLKSRKLRQAIPKWVHINFYREALSTGAYDLEKINTILREELGWQKPEKNSRNILDIACVFEEGRDYYLFTKFRNMENMEIPDRILKVAGAVYFGGISREKAMEELNTLTGYNLTESKSYEIMKSSKGVNCEELCQYCGDFL